MDEDEFAEDEAIDYGDYDAEPPSYRHDPVRLLVHAAFLAAGLAGTVAGFFANVGQDLGAHVNFRVSQREFHMAVAKEIETITEEQA